MKRCLLLLVLFALLGCNRRDGGLQWAVASDDGMAASVQATDNHEQQSAVLSDARNIYRICSTRPQRVLPTQSSQTQRTTGKTPVALRYLYCETFKHIYGGRCCTQRAPFSFVASRDYYVIALRHIIR